MLGALDALGVTFGAVSHRVRPDGSRGPALIEVNDRLIGDDCDFVLSDLLGATSSSSCCASTSASHCPPSRPARGAVPGTPSSTTSWRTVPACSPRCRRAGPRPTGKPGVRLSCRPLRAAGDRVVVTHTNRDYLGVISAIGTDAAAVEAAVTAAMATETWPVAGPRS